jgi:hypothetical protein
MCMCGKPTINGESGAYSWDGKHFSTRQPAPPALEEGDSLLFDEPGRCGGLDGHCHHFRLVKGRRGYALLVRHGGGDERLSLPCTFLPCVPVALIGMDSNSRYWLLYSLYSVDHAASRKAQERERSMWSRAAAEKRIKTRKKSGSVKVWIEDAQAVEGSAAQ